MTGAYRLKNEELRALWQKAKELEVYRHVRRTNQFITKADRLLNEAFDGPEPPGRIREF
jgi:hypothetical protein